MDRTGKGIINDAEEEMALRLPSKKWRSQKLAILESFENWLQIRLNFVTIVYSAALGLYVHWWIMDAFVVSFQVSNGHALLVLLSIFVLASFGFLGLALAYILKETRKRMNFSC